MWICNVRNNVWQIWRTATNGINRNLCDAYQSYEFDGLSEEDRIKRKKTRDEGIVYSIIEE